MSDATHGPYGYDRACCAICGTELGPLGLRPIDLLIIAHCCPETQAVWDAQIAWRATQWTPDDERGPYCSPQCYARGREAE
jgi:hypothetical protein